MKNASNELVAAVAQAAPMLTKREAGDVAITVLRKLSEFVDEDTIDPHADDLLVLADDIEGGIRG
jgi:hypothetical protein